MTVKKCFQFLVLAIASTTSHVRGVHAETYWPDWNEIRYSRESDREPDTYWDFSDTLQVYRGDYYDSDTANVARLTYRITDNYNPTYARDHFFGAMHKLAFRDQDESYLRLTAGTAWRFKFGRDARVEVPVRLDWTNYYNDTPDNSLRIGASPNMRVKLDDVTEFRFRVDAEYSDYYRNASRDDLTLRLRPEFHFSPEGATSYRASYVFERRLARDDVNSRLQASMAFGLTHDLGDDAYLDVSFLYSFTRYDTGSVPGTAGERLDVGRIEVLYGRPLRALNGAELTVGAGYEVTRSSKSGKSYGSPDFQIGIRKRF